jgi:hypothetical protein
VGQLADAIGVPAGEVLERLRSLRDRLAAARSAATLNGSLDDEDKRRHGEFQEAQAKLKATEEALAPLLAETGSADRVALGAAIERSRAKRGLADEIAATERAILRQATASDFRRAAGGRWRGRSRPGCCATWVARLPARRA